MTEPEKTPSTPELLAEMTGRPKEDFEYDGEIPSLNEQEMIEADEYYDD
jgi:hypothetical protein